MDPARWRGVYFSFCALALYTSIVCFSPASLHIVLQRWLHQLCVQSQRWLLGLRIHPLALRLSRRIRLGPSAAPHTNGHYSSASQAPKNHTTQANSNYLCPQLPNNYKLADSSLIPQPIGQFSQPNSKQSHNPGKFKLMPSTAKQVETSRLQLGSTIY